MSFESMKATIALLMDAMVERPEDAHEIQESLREKLSELRSLGLPLPEDLVRLEEQLEKDLRKES